MVGIVWMINLCKPINRGLKLDGGFRWMIGSSILIPLIFLFYSSNRCTYADKNEVLGEVLFLRTTLLLTSVVIILIMDSKTKVTKNFLFFINWNWKWFFHGFTFGWGFGHFGQLLEPSHVLHAFFCIPLIYKNKRIPSVKQLQTIFECSSKKFQVTFEPSSCFLWWPSMPFAFRNQNQVYSSRSTERLSGWCQKKFIWGANYKIYIKFWRNKEYFKIFLEAVYKIYLNF